MIPAAYLRPNVVVEPLIHRWHAWPHLIAPASAALLITERHLKIMRSFVRAPEVHRAACANAALRGGPFLDLGPHRVPEIRALISETERRQRPLIDLAEAIRELRFLLEHECNGHSLEPLYGRLPEPLRGAIEIFYDLRHQPSFRLIEPILYASAAYDASVQTLSVFASQNDERSFARSTPILPSSDRVELELPFDHPATDRLLVGRWVPLNLAELEDDLCVPRQSLSLFRSFFSTEPPSAHVPAPSKTIRVRYFGHGGVLVEHGIRVLFDPVISHRVGPDRLSYTDLPEIDWIVLTHAHSDHMSIETLLALRRRTGGILVPRGGGTLVDPGLAPMLRRLGFPEVREIGDLETHCLGPDVELTSLPFFGEHGDLDVRSKHVPLLRAGSKKLLFASDSRNLAPDLYARVARQVGRVNLVFIGLECEGAPLSWLYGHLYPMPLERNFDQSRRIAGSDAAMALDFVERFGATRTFVYALGREPWLDHLTGGGPGDNSMTMKETRRFVELARTRGIEAEVLHLKKEFVV